MTDDWQSLLSQAQEASQMQSFNDAEQLYKKALASAQDCSAPAFELAQIAARLGHCFYAQNKSTQSTEMLARSMDYAETGDLDPAKMIDCLEVLINGQLLLDNNVITVEAQQKLQKLSDQYLGLYHPLTLFRHIRYLPQPKNTTRSEILEKQADIINRLPIAQEMLDVEINTLMTVAQENVDVQSARALIENCGRMADVYYWIRDFEGEVKTHDRAIKLAEHCFGPESEDVVPCLKRASATFSLSENYLQSQLLLERAIKIREKLLGQYHPDVEIVVTQLAIMHSTAGEVEEAEKNYLRAIEIAKNCQDTTIEYQIRTLRQASTFYGIQKNVEEQKKIQERALALLESSPEQETAQVASMFETFAMAPAHFQPEKIEELYKRCLAIREKVFPQDHPKIADALINLASHYAVQKKDDWAEPLYKRALAIQEKVYGPDSSELLSVLWFLGQMYFEKGKDQAAETALKRSMKIIDQIELDGKRRPWMRTPCLRTLANLYTKQGNLAEAEFYFKIILKDMPPAENEPNHRMQVLLTAARVFHMQKKYAEAEPLYKRTLAILDRQFSPDTTGHCKVLEMYADMLHDTNRIIEAAEITKQISELRRN